MSSDTLESDGWPVRCIATTGDSFCGSISECHQQSSGVTKRGSESNLFKEAQFSADGTTIVTLNEDQCLRTFVLPIDLLDDDVQPHELAAYATRPSASNVQCYALYPAFSLSDSSTTIVLSAPSDLPIRLNNALDYGAATASYSLVNRTTEAYITPNSLAFSRDGTRFMAGSKGQLSVFNIARDGSGAIQTHRLRLGRGARQMYRASGSNHSGRVMALSTSSDGVLAVGDTGREISLWSNDGSGQCLTSFSVAGEEGERTGDGITSLRWSPCGHYLLVAERHSDCIQVWDVRSSLKRLGFLTGRNADTPQKLGMDVVPTASGYEVWAGGTDGRARVWKDPGSTEGEQAAYMVLKLHDDPVTSAIWHPGGAVLATCSGQRFVTQDATSDLAEQGSEEEQSSEDDSNSSLTLQGAPSAFVSPALRKAAYSPDNTLKIWTL